MLKDQVLLATFLQTYVFEWSPVKENDCEAAEMKSLNSTKSRRLLDFVPSIRPSFLSVILVFVCGCLWVKNETTNNWLFALEYRIDYLPCVNIVKRASFERMTRSLTKVTSNIFTRRCWHLFQKGSPIPQVKCCIYNLVLWMPYRPRAVCHLFVETECSTPTYDNMQCTTSFEMGSCVLNEQDTRYE